MEGLHLSYDEVLNQIPYINLLLMQYDKLHVVYGTLIKQTSGREMAARHKKNQ